jgi:serine/threonine protein kinase
MNILVDDGVARLCDFGLSRLVHQQELGDLTATTVYDGPERYMAPEIFASVDVQRVIPTYEGDIYALGCIMLEVGVRPNKLGYSQVNVQFIEGVYPFQRLSSNREVIDAILSRLPPALRCESTHTSPTTMDALWTLLDTCWGEPSSRPSIVAVVECVAGLVNSEGAKVSSPIVTNGPSCRNTDHMGGQAGGLEEGRLLYRTSACSDIAGAGRPWWGWKWIGRNNAADELSSERNLVKTLGIPVSTEGDKKKRLCRVV